MSSLNPADRQRLMDLVQECAVTKMRQFACNDGVQASPITQPKPIHGFWIAIILVSGEGLTLTFKTHFMTEQALGFVPVRDRAAASHVKVARDFMKEYCNLTAGLIKINLERRQIQTGISLPILARGFDELIVAKGRRAESGQWNLRLDGFAIVNTVEIDVRKELKLAEDSATTLPESGDVEFL